MVMTERYVAIAPTAATMPKFWMLGMAATTSDPKPTAVVNDVSPHA